MVAQHVARTATEAVTLREGRQRRAMVVVDVVAIVAAVGAVIASGIGASAPLALDSPRHYVVVSLLILWPVMLWETQSRASTVLGTGPEEYRRVLVSSLWTGTFSAAGAYAAGISRGRDALLAAVVLGTGLLMLGRNINRILLHRALSRTGPLHRNLDAF